MDLDDRRPCENEGRQIVALIPFVPYATSRIDRPEAMGGQFAPVADIGKALVAELRAARVFRSVAREPSPRDAWVLEGTLRSTRCTRADIFYGLSVLGPALWVFGMPASGSENEFAFNLRLRRGPASPVVWTFDLCVTDIDWYTAYSGRVDYRFDALLHGAMPRVLASLRETMLEASGAARPGS